MPLTKLPPTPRRTSILADPDVNAKGLRVLDAKMSRDLQVFLDTLSNVVNTASRSQGAVVQSADQTGAVATVTALVTPDTGMYRFSWYIRVTQAATVSSSATVTLNWTDGGVACSHTFTAVTNNITTVPTGGSLPLFAADDGTTISYSVAYASVGATPMKYQVSAIVEAVY